MTSDRPTPFGEDKRRDTLRDPVPWWNVERPRDDEERRSIQPGDGIFYWPEEETI